MPTYCVKYSNTEFYEKDYEADSYEEAQDMFDIDADKWYSTPYYSESECIDIQEV